MLASSTEGTTEGRHWW